MNIIESTSELPLTRWKILLIEDSEPDSVLIQKELASSCKQPISITHARRLSDATIQLHSLNFDVVILDLFLPDSQGLPTLGTVLAEAPHLPVVVMTGNRDEELGISAVRLGAQDYLVKGPEAYKRLCRTLQFAIERSRNKRRLPKAIEKAPVILSANRLSIDLQKQLIHFEKSGETQSIALTQNEFRIFVLLFRNREQVVDRGQIVAEAWGQTAEGVSLRSIDRHVSSIKKKCASMGISIHSIYGVGYKLELILPRG